MMIPNPPFWAPPIDGHGRPKGATRSLLASAVALAAAFLALVGSAWHSWKLLVEGRAAGFDGDKGTDGHSTLTSLTVFSLAQGAALVTLLSKGLIRDTRLLVLWVFVGLSILNILGILTILRAPHSEENRELHLYNRGTIRFGHWALITATIISAGLVLGIDSGIVPVPTARVPYLKKEIACFKPRDATDALVAQNSFGGKPLTTPMAPTDDWYASQLKMLGWLADGAAANCETKGRLYFVLSEPFDAQYETFTARINTSSTICGTKLAFLFRDKAGAANSYQPVTRQLHFIQDKGKMSNEFEVTEPDKDEILVILIYAPTPPELTISPK